jgi:hypothetical protein
MSKPFGQVGAEVDEYTRKVQGVLEGLNHRTIGLHQFREVALTFVQSETYRTRSAKSVPEPAKASALPGINLD